MLSSFLVASAVFTASAVDYQRDKYYVANCQDNNGKFNESNCNVQLKSDATSGSYEAYGMYNDDVESAGWGKLWVHGSESNQVGMKVVFWKVH